MNEFRQYTGSIKYKLADCAKYFGVSFSAHDAYEDARTTAECMEKLINSQGFVNTDPPKRKSKEKRDGDTPDRSKDKLPLQGRLLGPFLKRRRFRPLIVGIFLTIISLGYLVYQTYGPGLAGNIGKIHFSFILETAMQSKLNMCFGAVFLIGCICLAYGIPKAIVHSVRWIINLFRRILSG